MLITWALLYAIIVERVLCEYSPAKRGSRKAARVKVYVFPLRTVCCAQRTKEHVRSTTMIWNITDIWPLIWIVNTSYQKLPYGSGDYPDKLLFHQALNYVSNSSDRELPRDMFRL